VESGVRVLHFTEGMVMAEKKQLERLKKVEAWNEWRVKNHQVNVDLSAADLSGADLSGANLSKANLSWADLSGADLSWADLSGADLDGANLCGAHLDGANLRSADLSTVDLRELDLGGVQLSGADLSGVDLSGADLSGAHLSGSDLRGADLRRTQLSGADLSEADLSGAIASNTCFINLDLSHIKGLDKIQHLTASSIGIDTIYKSKGNIPDVFLRGCGVPENLIAYMHSLTNKAFDVYSCFISHSEEDKTFSECIYADLQANGIRTWYFAEDAKWGKTVWGDIDRKTKIYDQLVVVLSENSLQTQTVLREIERSLDREEKEHKNILFPITLDPYVFDTWEHERKADVVGKLVGDFIGWDKDPEKYGKAFDELLKGLKAKSAKT
jgi:uncharacterized protein YjbI with pentapeptide repeats